MSNTNSNHHDIDALLTVLAKFGWESHHSTVKDLVAELDKYKAVVRRLWEILESAAVRSPVDQTIADALSELVAERNQLKDELERERMRLAACGVAAMSNTRETAKLNRQVHDEYRSASLDDVCAAVDREMALRERVADLEAQPPADRDLRKDLICAALSGISSLDGWRSRDAMADDVVATADAVIAAMRKGGGDGK